MVRDSGVTGDDRIRDMPFLAFALVAALQTATPLGPAAKASTAPTPVRVADLHLTYDVPTGLAMDPGLLAAALKEESDNAQGIAKTAMACVRSPVMAADPTDNFRMVVLVEIDFTCLGQPATEDALSEVATSTLKESLHRFGDGVLTAPVKYKVGDMPAAFVRGSVKSDKFSTTFYGSTTCVLVDKRKMGCWEFVALKPGDVDTLGAVPVHFDGHEAVALVPAAVSAQAK